MSGFFKRFAWDRRANVAALTALLLIPLLGALGLAGEVSSWFMLNRAMQNAADSAAIAAATNGDATNQDKGTPALYMYQREADAAAAKYGYVNGANAVQVLPSTVTCPSGSGTCFQVKISKPVPLYLVRIVGFNGNTTLSGSPAQTIAATAIASSGGGGTSFCVLALGGTVNSGVTANGGPKTDLSGCSVGSNGDETCNGHDLNADAGYAYYSDSGCGVVQHSDVSQKFSDPVDFNRAANIPPNTCSSYPQEVSGVAASQNQLATSYTGGGVQIFCGDVQLGTTTVDKKGKTVFTPGNPTLAAGTVIVIENGTLDTAGGTLTASGATIIFTGPTVSGLSPSHFPTGGGTLNLTAPTSGTWSGVAIYQDPNLPSGSGVDISAAGNSPTWNIVGMVYLPNSNVTISGAVNKNSNGSCIGLVVNTLTINGTGYILDHNGCAGAGVTLPGIGATRVALVK